MLRDIISKRLLDLSLQIPLLYHGVWNIIWGKLWWEQNFARYELVRFLIGSFEIIAAFSLLFNYMKTYCLFLFSIIMIGAIVIHWESGYSFKVNGYETPLTYLLLSVSILLKESKNHEKK